jgi:hypothetical protein
VAQAKKGEKCSHGYLAHSQRIDLRISWTAFSLENCFDFSRQAALLAAATEHANAPGLLNIPKTNGPPNALGGPHKK